MEDEQFEILKERLDIMQQEIDNLAHLIEQIHAALAIGQTEVATPKCTGRTKSGRPCRSTPIKGTDRCLFHPRG